MDRKSDTIYFYDWFNVDKGAVGVRFDPGRVTEKGRKYLAETTEKWGLHFEFTTHGFKRERIPYGIRLSVEQARKSPVWLVADQPWEKMLLYFTVLKQGGKFRCWYIAWAAKNDREGTEGYIDSLLCYAESDDGLVWHKPNLGIHEFNGSKDNNICEFIENVTNVFYDENAVASERYKCFQFRFAYLDGKVDGDGCGLFAVTSPDGFHWTIHPDRLFTGFYDTENIGYWDAAAQKYLGFFRGSCSGRAISRSETTDFRQWPKPKILLWQGTEANPSDDYYTNCFCVYPDDPRLKMFFCAVYHRCTDLLDVRFAVSRDGEVFNWVTQDPIIAGGQPGETDYGAVYAQPNLVRMNDGSLGLPYIARLFTHSEAWFSDAYGDYPQDEAKYRWAYWPDGRLAGIEADNIGEFYTYGMTMTGSQIELNFKTHYTGSLELELQENNQAVEGYTFADCLPESGDFVWKKFQWKNKKDVAELIGRKLVLRFRLNKAKIYAVRLISG